MSVTRIRLSTLCLVIAILALGLGCALLAQRLSESQVYTEKSRAHAAAHAAEAELAERRAAAAIAAHRRFVEELIRRGALTPKSAAELEAASKIDPATQGNDAVTPTR
jgi:hypothetical protein